MKFTVEMRLDRETKNALRYQEAEAPGEPVRIGSQYVQKSAFNGAKPATIKLTVECDA